MSESKEQSSAAGSLKAQLRGDLTAAMKAKDTVRTGTLRMLLAAVQTEEVAGKTARELSDAEVVKVLAREAKKRREAEEVYTEAGRAELAATEHAELGIIEGYLPTQLSDAELGEVVERAIAQVRGDTGEAPGMRQMGQVMGVATKLAEGRADGKRLSAAVKGALG